MVLTQISKTKKALRIWENVCVRTCARACGRALAGVIVLYYYTCFELAAIPPLRLP